MDSKKAKIVNVIWTVYGADEGECKSIAEAEKQIQACRDRVGHIKADMVICRADRTRETVRA